MDALERAMRASAGRLGSGGPPPIDFLRAGVIPENAELDAALAATAEVTASWLGRHLPHLEGTMDQLLLEGYLDAERARMGHPLAYDVWLWGAECGSRYDRAWRHATYDPIVERPLILWSVVNSCASTLFDSAMWADGNGDAPVSVGFDPELVSGQVHSAQRRIVLSLSLCDGTLIAASAEVLRLLSTRAVTSEPDWDQGAVAAAQAGYAWGTGRADNPQA